MAIQPAEVRDLSTEESDGPAEAAAEQDEFSFEILEYDAQPIVLQMKSY